jgi:hypothetical protein
VAKSIDRVLLHPDQLRAIGLNPLQVVQESKTFSEDDQQARDILLQMLHHDGALHTLTKERVEKKNH